MAKSYPEQLGDWVKRRESTQRDKNLVAFLAVRDDVKAAVDAGYAVKTIWSNMSEAGRVNFGYDTFLNYTNRLIRRQKTPPPAAPDTTPALTESTRSKPSTKKTAPPKVVKPEVTGFTFNSAPKKEDFL